MKKKKPKNKPCVFKKNDKIKTLDYTLLQIFAFAINPNEL